MSTVSTALNKFLAMEKVEGLLIIGDSICDPDMYYLSRFLATDRFVLLGKDKITLLVSGMEQCRAINESVADEVTSTEDYGIKEKMETLKPEDAYIAVLKEFLSGHGVERVAVPKNFPAGIYLDLSDAFEVSVVKSPVKHWRSKKGADEIEAIRSVQKSCEAAMGEAVSLIERSVPRGEYLYLDGLPLTSERVRSAIDIKLLELGCEATGTIVSGGKSAAIPHDCGSGPLPANSPIVIDIFPRSKKTRYYSDMTRTVLRGEAPSDVIEMYNAVRKAQEAAIKTIRAGESGRAVHRRVCEIFDEEGFTERDETGFIHSTGHGVGLEVHEEPHLSEAGELLEAGNVVTVEPGLYYPERGGIRIEDLILVTQHGYQNLTFFEKRLVV